VKILVVDDSQTVRINLKKIFSTGQFVVLEASNGLEALKVLEDNKNIQLVVSDLNMPEMDGMEFIEHARKIKEFTDTPVLICTTEVCDNLKMRAKNLGVRAWMQKPVKLPKILGVLNMLLDKL